MPIVGLDFTKIHGERKGMSGTVNVNTTSKIIDVKKSKLKGFGKDVDVLNIEFEFESILEPNVGEVRISGALIYKTDKEEDTEKILKTWKKDKKLPMEMNAEIVNHLFRKASVKALLITDSLQLPPIIGVPEIKLGKE